MTKRSRVSFLGSSDVETRQVAAAVKPGVVVKIDSNNKWEVTGAAADAKGRIFLLEANAGQGQTYDTEFVVNTTAEARMFKANDRLNPRVDAGTYSADDALALSANGNLKAAATGELIVAYVLPEGASTTAVTAGTPIAVVVPHTFIAK